MDKSFSAFPSGGARGPQRDDASSGSATRCAVCLKEVPADAVNVADAQDYVHHFCGLDCLDLWRKRAGAPRPGTVKR